MASFFSRIGSMFSGGGNAGKENEQAVKSIVHDECIIFAEPAKEGSQYRLQGRIEKDVNDETLTRTFIRADLFSSQDEAIEWTFRKGRQIIDQNGKSLFSDGAKSRTA
ncbi:HlyU family transcriptional regulator [Martelella limonii]|uniref:HlyU family transcriptional regulator n=1 Tax=Martelella limonii TaxID=1647649 RepID=UPI001580359B|nr:HlyU family transcriptional regulator [Martelella limonii]